MPRIDYHNAAGKRISGVTTILNNLGWKSQALKIWANRLGLEGKDVNYETKALDIGSCAHHLIECHVKGKTPEISQYPADVIDGAETAFLNYLEWERGQQIETISTEVSLVSEKYQYGGTLDRVAIIKGKRGIIDYKCANGVYEDNVIQLAAYGELWDELHPNEPIEGYHLLRIGKENALFDYRYWDTLPGCFEAFKICLDLHNLHKKIKGLV